MKIKISATGEHLPSDATGHVAVLDQTAGLMWSANDIAEDEINWRAGDAAAKSLELLGHKDWRLPTVEELFLLADRTRRNPAIDTDFFPSCKSGWYHTSSAVAGNPFNVWFVHFGYGGSGCLHRGGTAWVRAVRSVSPPSQ